MAIYAYGKPEGNQQFVYDSLVKDGISRFLWSWFDNCDLNRLKYSAERRTTDERTVWSKGQKLLHFRPGDWILHKDVPEWGQITVSRLSSEYFYQAEMPAQHQDGRHCFHVDKVFTFARGDGRLHRLFYAKLKVRGALHQIREEKEFYESLIAVGYKLDDIDKKRREELDAATDGDANHFKRELNEVFSDLTGVIQRNHPGKKLEGFLAEVFRKIPAVLEVKENGSGRKSDFGADLLVKSKKGLIVIQVKSYVGEVNSTNAVEQPEMAINHYNAAHGIIITTGESTPALTTEVKKLAEKMHKQNVDVRLMSGSNVAKFVLRHALDLLI